MLEGLEIAQQEVGLTEVSCNTKRERQKKEEGKNYFTKKKTLWQRAEIGDTRLSV